MRICSAYAQFAYLERLVDEQILRIFAMLTLRLPSQSKMERKKQTGREEGKGREEEGGVLMGESKRKG